MATPSGNLIERSAQIKTSSRRWFYGWVALTALLIVVTLGSGTITEWGQVVAMFGFIAVIPGIGLYITGWNAYTPSRVLEIYTDGFALRRKRDNKILDASLWQDVSDITWSEDRQTYRSRSFGGIIGLILAAMSDDSGEEVDLYIHRPDHKKLLINTTYRDPVRPRMALCTAAKDVWLPGAIHALETGQTVHFGKLALSMEGIHQGKKLVPWPSVVGAEYQNERGVIKILWNDPARRKDRTMYVKLGYRGNVLVGVINNKLGKKPPLASKLGRL